MIVNIPCGNGSLAFPVDENSLLGILENKNRPGANAKKLVLKTFRQKEIPFGKKKVLIVVPDATRSAHLNEILPSLLEKISAPSRTIDIIIATGLHKPHTYDRVRDLLGSAVLKNHKVLQHDALKGTMTDFGRTKYGIPVTLDSNLKNYDYVISVGVIEPHLYAGYSGGAKTIAIGLAGEATVNATHNIKFLDNPAVAIGSVEGNPFQETLWHVMENSGTGAIFSINIVNNSEGKALKIFSGPVTNVFSKGIEFARMVFEVKVREEADIVVCGIGRPKDANLYQASRAINYVLNVDKPVVRKGGVVIVAAELRDGIGDSIAENIFYRELKNITSPANFVSHVKMNGCIAGEHRAYMVAKALLDYNIVFVTKEKMPFMEGLPFKCFNSPADALNFAKSIVGKEPKIYVIPRALATIARMSS